MFGAGSPQEKEDISCHPLPHRNERNQTWFPEFPAENSVTSSQPAPWEDKIDLLVIWPGLNVNTALPGKERQWKPATPKHLVSKTAASGHLSKVLCLALLWSVWVTTLLASLSLTLCSSLLLGSDPSTIHLLQLRGAGSSSWCISWPPRFRNGRKSSVKVPCELWQNHQRLVMPGWGELLLRLFLHAFVDW